MRDWVTLQYSRRLSEDCKAAIMEKFLKKSLIKEIGTDTFDSPMFIKRNDLFFCLKLSGKEDT